MNNDQVGRASALRRRRIVEAAIRLFAQAPYPEVHMDAIAAEAAVAKPTLYRYFPNKEVLFIEALERTLIDLRVDVEAIRSVSAPADERLRRVVALIVGRIGRLAPAIQASEQASVGSATESRRVLRQGFGGLKAAVAGIVADGVDDGLFGEVDSGLASLVIIGGARMAAHAQTGAELAGSIADLFIDGLAGARRQRRAAVRAESGAFA